MNKKEKKENTLEYELEDITLEEAKRRMEKFFSELEEKFKGISDDEMLEGAKKVKKFVDGNVSLAEMMNYPPKMLYQIAEHGYAQFRSGRFEEAEKIFKVLSFLDFNNPYYHSMMGAILQHQRRYGEAATEYTQALELDPDDIAALVNRGEIFLKHNQTELAKLDFESAISKDKKGTDKFAARAKLLLENMKKGDE